MFSQYIETLPLGEWGPMLGEALDMFLFLGVELTALFLIISFIVGVIQEFLPAHKIQSILSSKSGKGYFSAALLGGVTPFCSCSTIPMLTGLLKAKAGFGPTLTFLFTSPLLNPIIIGLFWATFGLEVTVMYASIALLVSVGAGFFLEKMNFDRFIRPEVFGDKPVSSCATSCGDTKEEAPAATSCCDSAPEPKAESNSGCCDATEGVQVNADGTATIQVVQPNRWVRIWKDTWNQFLKVLPYLLIGIAIGAFTYGFMPADLIVKYAGPENPLAIPVAAVIGVPLYVRAEAVIPLSAALAAKGMGMGAVMALIIGSAGASLTEVILLKSMFKKQMIFAFLTVIFGMAILAGVLFNMFF
ncbi:permease [Terasakiella pusilla]|uniref:permease n=1 Tax=Terasakiella pusilla TaxID=64973 RepID=UPI003AA97BC3